jgi:hypothetical protein
MDEAAARWLVSDAATPAIREAADEFDPGPWLAQNGFGAWSHRTRPAAASAIEALRRSSAPKLGEATHSLFLTAMA